MPVYHHLTEIKGDHFVLHTGTMSVINYCSIYKGAYVRDMKTDTSLIPLPQEMKDNILFDKLQRRAWHTENVQGRYFEWFQCVFDTKDGDGEIVWFKYHAPNPFYTREQMC